MWENETSRNGILTIYVCAEQEIPGWKGKWKGGGKVHDNRGMGTAEIILILAVLIILTLIFRKQLAELAAWFYGSLYR